MDKALKQRLVGASVLIILAVIVLPMLLSGRSDTLKQESRQIELPPKPEELSIETRRFPVGTPNRTAKTTRQDSTSINTDEKQAAIADQDGSLTDGEDPTASSKAEPVDDTTPASIAESDVVTASDSGGAKTDSSADSVTKPPDVTSIVLSSGRPKDLDVSKIAAETPDTGRYLVQVGSYSNEKNASKLVKLLQADNLPVLTDVVERVAGRLYRVRVGPYAERSEADAVVSRLRSKMIGLTPRVQDLRPAESSPVSTPSDPLVRWVVQVSSTSNAKNAEALVSQLQLGGFAAFSEKVTSADGTVYKVRIGPELDREKAAELARRVKTEKNLDAFVTTQE